MRNWMQKSRLWPPEWRRFPVNQLAMQKMVINAAVEEKINQTQRLATVFDGITRHSPEGINFKARVETVGWKQAVAERDTGSFDWTTNQPINDRSE